MKFATENGYSTEKANDELVKLCLIPYDTIRKTIVGTTKCIMKCFIEIIRIMIRCFVRKNINIQTGKNVIIFLTKKCISLTSRNGNC